MSYKFQRLRERIRQSVTSGELSGKLPGERELARQFNVNAKTLSKALTDLAAEGLLQRSIGRGTFVRGSDAAEAKDPGSWMILCDWSDSTSPTVRALLEANPESRVVHDVASLRPSFVNQFTAAIDLTGDAPPEFVRDLMVRAIPFVAVGQQPKTYATHAVLRDIAFQATCVGRELMLAGHRRFLAVESRKNNQLSESLRKTALRYAPEATVDPCFAREVSALLELGPTALVCDSVAAARDVMAALSALNKRVPEDVSVAAVGCIADEIPCSGFYTSTRQQAQAIVDLLRDMQISRPTTVWLSGTYVDHGTTGPLRFETYHEEELPLGLRFPSVAV
jgi:hypothetical protein